MKRFNKYSPSYLVDLKDQVLDVSLQRVNFVSVLEVGRDGAQQGLVQLETLRDVLQAGLLIGKQGEGSRHDARRCRLRCDATGRLS